MGETPNISEYLDFGWYDFVWFKEDAGLGETKIGRFLGVSHSMGSLLSYIILPISGIPVTRTTVQRMMEAEKTTEATHARMTEFDRQVTDQFKGP